MGKKSSACAVFLLAVLLAAAQETGGTESGPVRAGDTEYAEGQAASLPEAAPDLPLLPVPALPVEAPESLLSLQLGDADVELIAEGYWAASVIASGAFGFGANSGASAPTILFQQTPDLWISLVLMEKWFMEATLTADGFGDEYAVGYRGGEGEFLQEVRIGNKGVSFPELPFLALGAGARSSFGLAARGKGPAGSAHFLLRYDQARRVAQTWVGDRELSATEFRPSEYIRGRFFILPDSGVTDLELYIESSSGDLAGSDERTYRRMVEGEYSASLAMGRVDLAEEVGKDRRLLVYYNGVAVPATAPGPPFYNRPASEIVAVDSVNAIVLYEKGKYEGFLIVNRYNLPSSASAVSAQAYVRNEATGLPDGNYTATILSDGYVQVVRTGAGSDAPADFPYRMPFASDPDPDSNLPWVYDPEATTEAEDDEPIEQPAPAYSRTLVLETYGASGDIVLEDEGILPGSVEVRRNGVLDYGFTYVESTGAVKLDREPGISETIEVSYLLSSSDRSAGSLAAALGAVFDLSPDWKAWTALGMRWGVPGTGYSGEGESVPGSLTLTAGFQGGTPQPEKGKPEPSEVFRAEAALAASYRREDATGYYKAAGMEESQSWTSPFFPTGSWPDVTVAYIKAVTDESLETLFPDLYKRFHSAVSSQRALVFSFSGHGGGEVSAVRYVEPIQAGNYKTFAFFARRQDADDVGAELVVEISGGDTVVRVELPLDQLDAQWRRYLLRYDGVPRLYRQDGEGGAETLVGGGATFYADASQSGGEIRITVSGVTDGSVFVDELYFQDPVGEFSVSGRGAVTWKKAGTLAEVSGYPIVSDAGVTARLTGTASEDSAAAGYLDGSIGLGPLDLSVKLQQGYSGGGFSDGAFGHGIALPLEGFRFEDSFEYSPGSDRFGRSDKLSVQAGKFSLALEQSAAYTDTGTGAEGFLEQDWSLKMAAGNVFSLNAALENDARGEADLDSGYGNAWIGAFRYFLPAFEDDSTRRRSELGGRVRVGGALWSFSAESLLSDASSPTPEAQTSGDTRFGWSFPVGNKGTIEPYYRRRWSFRAVEESGSFADDWALWAGRFAESEFLYRSVPYAELFDDITADRFEAVSEGSAAAEYRPEAGIVMSRRYGSRWTDILAPSKGTLSLRRELKSSLQTVTDALVTEVTASAAAVNLFGSRGAYRSTDLYSMDEFSQQLAVAVAVHREDGAVLTTFTHKAFAAFYTSRDDSLVAENRVSAAETRDGTAWSELLSLTLTTRPTRTWLGDLAGLALDKPRPDKDGQEGEKTRPNIVSGYFESLRGARRNHSEIWSLSVQIKRPYAYLERFDILVSESYEAKLVSPEKLSLGASLGTWQELDRVSGLNYWTLGVKLTVSAKVMF